VIHLPAGDYQIDSTITIPKGSDVQLAGDGLGTRLQWAGKEGEPLLRIIGQSHATLRDLSINGAGIADGVVVENCDQPGSRIFMEQANVGGAKQVGFLADRMMNADVSLHDFNHAGCGVGVKVIGTNEEPEGRVVIFSGASSNNELSYDVTDGGKLLARDIWYESGEFPRFMHLTGSGTLTLHGAEVAVASKEGIAPIEIDDFRGNVALITAILVGSEFKPATVLLKGDGKDMNVLLLGVLYGIGNNYLVNESPNAKFALREPFMYTQGGGSEPIPDQGSDDPNFIRKMLAQTREERPGSLEPLPENVADFRIFRVIVSNVQNGITVRP
jgi:hypothetical protein